MEEKKQKVILARLCGAESDALMDTMEGKVVPICQDNVGGSNYLSSVAVNPNYDALGSEAAKMAARKNAMTTMGNHAFFFYGDSLDEVEYAISILAKEPKDMQGFLNAENGVAELEDCLADGREYLLVMEADADIVAEMCDTGLIGTGSCEYGPDYERTELNEMILGDEAIRRLIAGKGKILAFDSPENVYENLFGSDFNALFGGSSGKRRSLRRDDYDDDYGDDYGDDFGGYGNGGGRYY